MTRMRKAEHCYQQEIADLRKQLAAAPTVPQAAPALDEQREREEFEAFARQELLTWQDGPIQLNAAGQYANQALYMAYVGWLGSRRRLHAPDRDEARDAFEAGWRMALELDGYSHPICDEAYERWKAMQSAEKGKGG